MKKKILGLVTILTLSFALIACGGTDNAENNTENNANATDKEETDVTEKHEHAYAEEITTPATCEADGVKTFTCECGDTYTEVITATGHSFEVYASNNDATYTADGTETSKCSNCDVTDTRTAEGSMLTYTYTDMDATMYVQETVNVRNLPNTDGEKLGGLNQNDEVHVTGQCAETSWYRIEYSGGIAYVSNSYLGTDKVVVQEETPTQNTTGGGYNIVLKNGETHVDTTVSSYAEACAVFSAIGYTPWTFFDNGGDDVTYFGIVCHAVNTDKGTYEADFRAAQDKFVSIMESRGYNPYPVGNNGGFDTYMGRIYVKDAGGGSWSIAYFGKVQ